MSDLETQLRMYAKHLEGSMKPPQLVRPVLASAHLDGKRRRPLVLTGAAFAAAACIAAIFLAGDGQRVVVDTNASTQPAFASGPGTSVTAPVSPAPAESLASSARSAGIAGVRATTGEGTAVSATTVTGQSFTVTVPNDLPGLALLQLVPEAAIGIASPSSPSSYLTTMPGSDVAAGTCREVPGCQAATIEREQALANRASFKVWNTGAAPPVVTVEMGRWTLVLDGPEQGVAEHIAAALSWAVDAHGYLTLRSTDRSVVVSDGGVRLTTTTSGDPSDGVRIHVAPGCGANPERGIEAVTPQLSRFGTGRPGAPAPVSVKPAYGGAWCASGAYRVEVITGDWDLLDRLHQKLTVGV